MHIYTQNGNWPNDQYFKGWEIYNANSNTETSARPIIKELKKIQHLYLSKETDNSDSGVFSETNVARKWDLTHIIARAAAKDLTSTKDILSMLVDSYRNERTTDIAKLSCLGACNTILSLSFDNIPKNNKNMVCGIDLKEFEDHILVLKKNDESINITGYEYMNAHKQTKDVKLFIENALDQKSDIYKTTYIVAQIYKRAKMDIYGNITYLDLW